MKENLEILRRNRAHVSALELRLDMLDLSRRSEVAQAKAFPRTVDLPVILTLRRTRDGGRCTLSDDERKPILRDFSQCGFSYVDLEVDLNFPSLEYDLMARGVDIIRSLHDFSGIPRDLPELAKVVSSCGEIPKLAVTPKGVSDELELFRIARLIQNLPRKIILGMGAYGLPTRILYRRLGGLLTFCSEADPNGLGLPSPRDLCQTYHSPDINGCTKIRAVANPTGPVSQMPGSITVPFKVDDEKAFRQLCEMESFEIVQ